MPKSQKSKNCIEVHCYLESDRGARYDEYELLIRIGKMEFGIAECYKGRSSVMRAAKRISEATRLPIREGELDA